MIQIRRIKEPLISVLILLQLFAALIYPNPRSYLTQAMTKYFDNYMHFFGLNYTWGFFAPEPVYPPLFIDYIFHLPDGQQISGRFPEEHNPYFFRDRYNRIMSMSKFIMGNDDNIKNMFMNYFCHKYPNIQDAMLWRVRGIQPSLEMVQKGERKMTDAIDYKIDPLGTFYCPELSK